MNVIIQILRWIMEETKKIKIASLLGIFGNLFLLVVKSGVGLLFKSQAMIADATNSAGDIFASVMAFVGNKISTEPADEDHNVGHGKAEYIFSLFIGLAMILASLIVIINSIKSIITNHAFNYSFLLVIICILTIIIKLSLYIYTKIIYKKNSSILLKSLYKDHRNDCLITCGTLVSILFSLINIYWIDSVAGILISFWIIFTGLKIINESYDVLMDQSIDNDSKLQIENIIYQHSKEIEMGKMSSIPIGYKYIIVLTIYVDGKMSTKDAHEITKILQTNIKNQVKRVDRVIIHVNPKE
ncbi:MAG: cation transporter [Firmicutes bacterium]|nr:cation transporter [Bacillota bacterium]